MTKIMIVGTDRRSLLCGEFLKKNHDISIIYLTKDEDLNIKVDLYLLPIPLSIDGKNVNNSQLDITIDQINNITKNKVIVSADSLNRDDFAYKNAVPTAEAAIKIAIDASEKTLFDSKILIAGYGRVAKILADRLSVFTNELTIAARKSGDKSLIESKNIKFLPIDMLANQVNKFDIIFNTVPFQIFDKKVLNNADPETIFIELASNTLGFDKESINHNNLKFINSPGLPGIYSPYSAAKILAETIEEIIKENNLY